MPRMLYFGCHLVGALIESYEARSTYPVLRCPFGRVTSEPHGKFPRRTTGLITSMSCTGPSGLGCYSLATCLNAYIFPLSDTSCGGRWKHPAGVTPVGSLCYFMHQESANQVTWGEACAAFDLYTSIPPLYSYDFHPRGVDYPQYLPCFLFWTGSPWSSGSLTVAVHRQNVRRKFHEHLHDSLGRCPRILGSFRPWGLQHYTAHPMFQQRLRVGRSSGQQLRLPKSANH